MQTLGEIFTECKYCTMKTLNRNVNTVICMPCFIAIVVEHVIDILFWMNRSFKEGKTDQRISTELGQTMN